MNELLRVTHRWLQPDRLTGPEIVKRVTMDRFLKSLRTEVRKTVGMCNSESPLDMTKALEKALIMLRMGKTE